MFFIVFCKIKIVEYEIQNIPRMQSGVEVESCLKWKFEKLIVKYLKIELK